jgi:hypothetical protein
VSRLAKSQVLLGFDLDVVGLSCAPDVQTPEVGDPSASEVLRLLQCLRPFRSGAIVVSPLEHEQLEGGIGARVGALHARTFMRVGGVSNDIVESVEPHRFVVAMDEPPHCAQRRARPLPGRPRGP